MTYQAEPSSSSNKSADNEIAEIATVKHSAQHGNGNEAGVHTSDGAVHAHHLKWGDIRTSGFAPPEVATDDESDADDPCHGTRDHTARRRKMVRDRSRELVDAEARRIHASRRYLFRRPRPLQYFRGNVLVRSNAERGADRLELFFDLTFVGIIAVLAQAAVSNPTGPGFVRYLITYTAAYMIWHWMREIFNSFHKDDLSQRLLVLFTMACLILFGNNAVHAEQNLAEGPARAVTVASFLLAEAAVYGTFLLYSFYIKAYRVQIRAHCAVWLVSLALMIGSIFVDVRVAIALSVVAIVWEWHLWMFLYSPFFKRVMKLRYSSAVAIEHEIDRYQDFFTIVMGEFVYSLFDKQPAGIGFHVKAGKAIMALMIAFSFQLFYTNGGWSKRITHPLRHSVPRAMMFFNFHLPIVSALTLCGDSLADFVKEDRVPSGVRWMACESYAVGMIMLWGLAMLEFERDAKGELWFPKWLRLLPRLCSGVVAIFLPLTYQGEAEHAVGEGSEAATAHFVTSIARHAVQVMAEANEGSGGEMGEGATSSEIHHGVEITTGKLLGILTALAFFTLLWETITSLDGPNAQHEKAADDLLQRAHSGHGIVASLSTPSWRGFPRLCEPGSGTFDHSHQREHDGLTPTTTNDSSTTRVETLGA